MYINYKSPHIKKCLSLYVEYIEAQSLIAREIEELNDIIAQQHNSGICDHIKESNRIDELAREAIALQHDVASCEIRLQLNNPNITKTQWN